ncbi:MAG: hypothetical protein NC084_06200 [Bacteroides sp.]|nr:hypothetical protein [Eubacterium sp.]MCM1418183.1 hypothetical protein [Roseburia sp.]MCM1462292.1 hypothetical protein [Bacteroides sp.]
MAVVNYKDIQFKNTLTLDEYNQVVSRIVEETARMFEAEQFGMLRYVRATALIGAVTNIKLEQLSAEDRWRLINETKIEPDIAAHLGELYFNMLSDIQAALTFRLSLKPTLGSLIKTIDETVTSWKDKVREVDLTEFVSRIFSIPSNATAFSPDEQIGE